MSIDKALIDTANTVKKMMKDTIATLNSSMNGMTSKMSEEEKGKFKAFTKQYFELLESSPAEAAAVLAKFQKENGG